jgi:homogentisate 1,2-dioxygenase
MSYYYKLGSIPHKRHTQFRKPDGSLYHEELMGTRGFSGIQSLLYHLHPPTQIQKIGAEKTVDIAYAEQCSLHHRHLRTATVAAGGDAVASRVPMMANADVCISVARPTEAMKYWYRFAHGDEVIFIHEGSGVLESQYGRLRYGSGDYLVIPTGVLWRILPDEGIEQRMLVIEANGHIEPPARYINRYGQFLEHSPYNERDIRPPDELITYDEEGEFEVRVKVRESVASKERSAGRIISYLYRHHPLDVVGWDGHLWPFAFNIEDFEPITGRIHQPPPVHQTFDGPGFVICSFVPRLFDYHPLAIPAPYNHSNVDSDEVIYYVKGNFMSRKGIERSSITHHPSGIPHGPHPGTYEGSIGKERTEELAVMIDTFRPLRLTQNALALEDNNYPYSWIAEGIQL